jgi:hypothetical protein
VNREEPARVLRAVPRDPPPDPLRSVLGRVVLRLMRREVIKRLSERRACPVELFARREREGWTCLGHGMEADNAE